MLYSKEQNVTWEIELTDKESEVEDMRYGFTTGSCAGSSGEGGHHMLLTGREKTNHHRDTQRYPLHSQIRNICRKEQEVSCAVEKDGGDDPDITTRALICAKVSFAEKTDRKAREEPGRKNGTDMHLNRHRS